MRFAYIDSAKGLAILLVVIGHVVAREPPRGAEWYTWFKATIYLFHMPLFVFLSGLAYGFRAKPFDSWTDYLADVRKRVSRLLAAYLLLGALIFAGKLAFQQFVQVDNPVRDATAILDLLMRPSASYTSFLWYVYALSILYVTIPLALKAFGNRLLPLLALACVFPFLPESTLFTWNKLQEFSVFFVLGIAAARYHAIFEKWLVRLWPLGLVGFALLVPFLIGKTPALRLDACLAVVGILGVIHLPALRETAWLQMLGRYTLVIYLFNTIAIGVMKVVVLKTTGWEGPMFVPAFVALTAAGVGVPILLKRYVLCRVRWLDRIT